MSAASTEDMPLLNAFIVEHFERMSNNQVRENDACMQQHSQVAQYWAAKSNLTERVSRRLEMQTSASVAKKPSFLVLIACFLAMILVSYNK